MTVSQKREAGRALNAEIAARVMGWVMCTVKHGTPIDRGLWSLPLPERLRLATDADSRLPVTLDQVPEYSTDFAACSLVIAKMFEHRDVSARVLRLVSYPYNRTYATFDGHNEDEWTEANGEHHLTLAICRAALDACEAYGSPEARTPTSAVEKSSTLTTP